MENIIQAKKYFYEKNYKIAREIFVSYQDWYSAGLCTLLLSDTGLAKKYWLINSKTSSASLWGLCVLELIELRETIKPSVFQIRAFLEVYLSLFIENSFVEWAQNLISMADFLNRFNPESYKFIARALYSNGYFEFAITFIKKSLRIFPYDPEATLIMAQCYYLLKDNAEARDINNRTLAVFPDYYPALLFQKILDERG